MKEDKEEIGKKKNAKVEKVNKDMSFSEILERHPEVGEILMGKGMHCIGCPMAMMETLEQGCLAHGLDPKNVVKEINEKINAKEKSK